VIGSGKPSSLLWYGNNCCRKKFYSTGPCGQYYKTFFGVIYTTRDIFSYSFDWGYADSGVITPKSFETLAPEAKKINKLWAHLLPGLVGWHWGWSLSRGSFEAVDEEEVAGSPSPRLSKPSGLRWPFYPCWSCTPGCRSGSGRWTCRRTPDQNLRVLDPML
jgi:hypothetical protein